jgi:hypothetical protein
MRIQEKQVSSKIKIVLWCWDSRMTWDNEPNVIANSMAVSERPFPYMKKSESYAVGFRRLIDYCSLNGIYGIIIWGFLRDCHGGVGAAQDLCKYAADNGVAILPGVGLCAYGGYYFEGSHQFNLDTYLRKHPERISSADYFDKKVTPVLDPSLKENQDWWRDGFEWMLENFKVGGVDFEMGDFIVNPSAEAVKARTSLGFKADGNILDIVVATKSLMERAVKLFPDGLFINSTYRGHHQITGFPKMDYLKPFPKQVAWQYTLRDMVGRPDFPEEFMGAPNHRKYGYLHWIGAATNDAGKDYVSNIANVFPGLHKLDFEFVGTYGELSALNNPQIDRNYRAQVAWADNAELQLQDFN